MPPLRPLLSVLFPRDARFCSPLMAAIDMVFLLLVAFLHGRQPKDEVPAPPAELVWVITASGCPFVMWFWIRRRAFTALIAVAFGAAFGAFFVLDAKGGLPRHAALAQAAMLAASLTMSWFALPTRLMTPEQQREWGTTSLEPDCGVCMAYYRVPHTHAILPADRLGAVLDYFVRPEHA